VLPDLLLKQIEAQTGQRFTIIKSVSGGSINRVYYLESATAEYLLKVNSKRQFPEMFQRELEGLTAIANTNTIAVPATILQGDADDYSYLLLQWIVTGSFDADTSRLLGEQLAQMHRHTVPQFGFDSDNYMGSLPQSNRRHATWANFFINQRLQPMVKLGMDNGLLNGGDLKDFEVLYDKLSSLFTEEVPALIHGDLWSGNYLISDKGKPFLIDPAVCYGNREFDIAMTTLFGGFDQRFYDAYHLVYPLLPGWQQRINLWNLYPLLVHVNLFGGAYLSQTRQCLAQYL
jgi:protein-ribulosamine 3-kinase